MLPVALSAPIVISVDVPVDICVPVNVDVHISAVPVGVPPGITPGCTNCSAGGKAKHSRACNISRRIIWIRRIAWIPP